MLFHSLPFLLVFLPLALAAYAVIGRCGQPQNNLWFLALISLLFYGFYHVTYVPLLVGSILVNYWLGEHVCLRPQGRRWLVFGIVLNLATLGYYKYASFFLENLNLLTGSQSALPSIVLPLAISFFTFQQITYLVDRYRGEIGTTGLLRYAVCVLFFPHLIAGPIVHYRQMMPQFTRPTLLRLRADHLAAGLSLLAAGLFKKIILADNLATFANPAFANAATGEPIGMLSAWLAVLAFTFQIYFDFSGYTDMALGIARMFGIRLPHNFNAPYQATSIVEFWRRWHITLSRFLREYVYIPLGGNRCGLLRQWRNLGITMLLCGLWHGAAWHFVFWGGLHGVLLIIAHRWQEWRPLSLTHRRGYRLVAWALTFFVVMLSWVLFRADNLQAALHLYQAMLGGSLAFSHEHLKPLPWLAAAAAVAWFLPSTYALARRGNRWRWQRSWPWALGVAASLALCLMDLLSASGQVQEFIYWKF